MPGNTVDGGRYGRASPETQNRTSQLFSACFGGGSTWTSPPPVCRQSQTHQADVRWTDRTSLSSYFLNRCRAGIYNHAAACSADGSRSSDWEKVTAAFTEAAVAESCGRQLTVGAGESVAMWQTNVTTGKLRARRKTLFIFMVYIYTHTHTYLKRVKMESRFQTPFFWLNVRRFDQDSKQRRAEPSGWTRREPLLPLENGTKKQKPQTPRGGGPGTYGTLPTVM